MMDRKIKGQEMRVDEGIEKRDKYRWTRPERGGGDFSYKRMR